MNTVVTASECARSFSDIVNRVVYRGEEFIVERNGQPACRISPAEPFPGARTCTVAQFDNLFADQPPGEDPAFAADLEKIIRAQSNLPPAPWK